MWTQLFSIITVIASVGIILKEIPASSTPDDIKYASLTALSVWLLGDLAVSLNIPFQEYLHVILQSLSLSFLLIVFLIFIRKSKPIIFRYPYYMAFIPLLIPVAQIIVMETQIMREIIFMSLQGVAILVFILLTVAYIKEIEYKMVPVVGILLLLWGFAFYWILQKHYIVFEWAWALTNSLGVIACVYSFSDLLKLHENQ